MGSEMCIRDRAVSSQELSIPKIFILLPSFYFVNISISYTFNKQTNWSKRANKGRPYEKIIIAAGDTLIPHFSRKSVYSLHFSRVSPVCGTHIQRLFYLHKRLSALFALNENKPWGTLWVFVNCPQTLRLDATGSHCRHYIA